MTNHSAMLHAMRTALATTVMVSAMVASAATTASDPYVPGEGKEALAAELSVPVSDILVDRRCVYTKTPQWVATTTPKTMSTCTVATTPTRLILANVERGSGKHVVDLSFDYTQFKSVALVVKQGLDTGIYLDGKKIQIQFETDDGFISLTAWRSQGVKPYDARGGQDLFGLIASKGVPVVESKGIVDVVLPKITIFKY
jgi:hypothetical protein